MGAWIEMYNSDKGTRSPTVAPYMGAWIEIRTSKRLAICQRESHPTWVRGLKYPLRDCLYQ